MSRWNPCKRNDFVKRLRELGFEGAYSSVYSLSATTAHHTFKRRIFCSATANDAT